MIGEWRTELMSYLGLAERNVGLDKLLGPFKVGRGQQHGEKEIGPFQRNRNRCFVFFRAKCFSQVCLLRNSWAGLVQISLGISSMILTKPTCRLFSCGAGSWSMHHLLGCYILIIHQHVLKDFMMKKVFYIAQVWHLNMVDHLVLHYFLVRQLHLLLRFRPRLNNLHPLNKLIPIGILRLLLLLLYIT